MKNSKFNKIVLGTLLMVACGFGANAQLKVGSNPTTLADSANFQVEALRGNQFFIHKGSGRVGIGTTTPSTLLSNSNLRINGELGSTFTKSLTWVHDDVGYGAGVYNSSTTPGSNGLVVKTAGTGTGNVIFQALTGTQTGPGTSALLVRGDGSIGIGTTTPATTLSNSSSLIFGANGSTYTNAINWVKNDIGYAAGIHNSYTGGGGSNGLLVKTVGTDVNSVIFQAATGTQNGATTSALLVRGDGNVGISSSAPAARLHVGTQAGFPTTPYPWTQNAVISSGNNAAKGGFIMANSDEPTGQKVARWLLEGGYCQLQFLTDDAGNYNTFPLRFNNQNADFFNNGLSVNQLGAPYISAAALPNMNLYGNPFLCLNTNNATGQGSAIYFSRKGNTKFKFSIADDNTMALNGVADDAGSFRGGGFNFNVVTSTAIATSWVSTSDRRLKENIVPLNYGLNEVMKLNPQIYNYITDDSKSKHMGFIAQDMQKVMPELVNVSEVRIGAEGREKDSKARVGAPLIADGKQLGINYGELTPVLVKAIQEQQAQIEALKAEITALKASK